MTTPVPVPAAAPRRGAASLPWLLALILLALAAWLGWRAWQDMQLRAHADALQSTQRLAALEARLDALRGDQRAQAQRMQQAEATNRVLRDELLGFGQRAALLEDSVSKLADPARHGAPALRLDEVELLLGQGQQRLQLAGDLDGARHAYALAAQLLAAIADPAYVNLRQALAQERDALDGVGDDPRAIAAARLDAFAAALPALPTRHATVSGTPWPWWRRAFSRIVEVRPVQPGVTADPGARDAGRAALQLDLTLAQAAIERRDAAACRAALARADAWLLRLWPDSPLRRRQRQALHALQTLPLEIALPTLGSTLLQLRALRAAR